MGLDIYHQKATLVKPAGPLETGLDVLLRADWAGYRCNVGFEHFHRYVQLVDVRVTVSTLIWFDNPLDQHLSPEFVDQFRDDGDYLIDERSETGRARTIRRLERQHHLAGLPRYEWQTGPCRGRTYYREEPREGFYTTEVGYQRKGVNADFYRYFEPDGYELYAHRADFEYAYECVDRYWPTDTAADVAQRRAQFKADFLDSYEEGASFLWPSY